ncbi:MAG: hypothetical protein IJH83_00040, partial [Coriobacteriales bacterium]|nr:hypothetical protein [Coriobacteriales bacterium]
LKLEATMRQDDCVEIIRKLFLHQDERVRVQAAGMCIKQNNALKDEAKAVLREVIDSQDADRTVKFSAEMFLEIDDPTSTFYGW